MDFSFLSPYYLTLKALHIIFVVCWMAGLFYLPRLFYYHTLHLQSSGITSLFLIMEGRLLKVIMMPAQIGTYIFGLLLALTPGILTGFIGWFHLKIVCVLLLSGFHGFLVCIHRKLIAGVSLYTPNTYRLLNEVPTVLLILIVFLVVLKPF